MPIQFDPRYIITSRIASCLLRIESAKEKVLHLPLTPAVLTSLRETARLYTTHYSTLIEGNQLEPAQIASVLKHDGHFPGREREEKEVRGYYAALQYVEKEALIKKHLTEKFIQTLHAMVMSEGRSKIKPTPYREGQNVIQNSHTRRIVYMPPEAKDVPLLMKSLVHWFSLHQTIPSPILAAIVHYQFATIHPYYDGNGRTARLLTTYILHCGGYDLKGLYSLEEYYAQKLDAYYAAISIGPSHNYYLGRAEADITSWVEYFIEGMAFSFEKVWQQMHQAHRNGAADQADLLQTLNPKQRKALGLFQGSDTITARHISALFGFQPRTSAKLCQAWVTEGFLEIANPSNKNRSYRLAKKYR